jgi:hypothetical protein
MLRDVKAPLLLSASAVLAATAAIAAGATAEAAASAQCPLKVGSPSGGDVQWAFTETGPPTGKHPGIKSSYTHGRGNWTAGRATGTACSADTPTSGPSRNLVLAVSGKAKLSPGITELGLRGVGLVLRVRIKASDDRACAAGTLGTVTLFASYYAIHRDSVSLHFAAACSGHDHRYTGSQVHVLITRHGAQVNSA